jgi:hygromycin-B 4-O-kinase
MKQLGVDVRARHRGVSVSDTSLRDHHAVHKLIREHFGDDVSDIRPLSGGVFSRAFAFTAGDREYVLRLNREVHARESFAKDDYAWRHFASPSLPIPRIVATGETDGFHYAVSEKMAGTTMDACSPAERSTVLPALLDTVEAVGRMDVSGTIGYGDWGSNGNGKFASWRDYVASITDNHAEGFYEDWHRFYDESFLERDVFETVARRMLDLLEHCPEERSLVHNDLHFENIMSDGTQITGVLDWANALYGDPLYDVAWLSWQAANPGWWYDDGAEILLARFGKTPGYATRVTCYQLHIGLDHLRYYTRTNQPDRYGFCRDWLLSLIDAS